MDVHHQIVLKVSNINDGKELDKTLDLGGGLPADTLLILFLIILKTSKRFIFTRILIYRAIPLCSQN